MKRVRVVPQRRLAEATRTHPLAGCPTKIDCCFALGREGVVAQQMGGATGRWTFVGTKPGADPRILSWL